MTDSNNVNPIDPLFDIDGSFLAWDDTEEEQRPKLSSNQKSDSRNSRPNNTSADGVEPSNSVLSAGFHGLQSLPSFTIFGDILSDSGLSVSNGVTGQTTGALPAAQLMNGFQPVALMPFTGAACEQSSSGVETASQPKQTVSFLQKSRAAPAGSAHHMRSGATTVTASTAASSAQDTLSANRSDVASRSSGTASTVVSGQSNSTSLPATMALAAQQQAQASLPPVGQQGRAPATTPQLHPLGIQSSANCPQYVPLANDLMGANPFLFANMTGAAQPFLNTTNPDLVALFQAMHQQQMLASLMSSNVAASAATTQINQRAPTKMTNTAMSAALAAPAAAPITGAKKRVQAPNTKSSQKRKSTFPSGSDATSLPPFHLFDAPTELRHNFLQSQRMYNLPVQEDNNSLHYGMAVNGFHPQLNATENRVFPLSSNLGEFHLDPSVKLIDGRHTRKYAGLERNMREQKRAHKITQLIDELRSSMENDGWEIETKSKYHTLSTCADYVRHLVKSTKEKEEAIAKARSDLQEKERKMEEDKAASESRSDPESVASSLTTSSIDGERRTRNSTSDDAAIDSDKKKKALPSSLQPDEPSSRKRARFEFRDGADDAASSIESSSGDDRLGFRNISLGKMSSVMSDMTDSNRGSSDGGENTNLRSTRRHNDEGSAGHSSSSISSTAVVVRGEGSNGKQHGHSDVVVERKRKRRHRERSSVDKNFDVDFEEVFLTSNIPQLMATPAGRIITCNDFFLKATGLSMEEVSRLTIFSIVKADKLANLFEMVAEALQTGTSASRQGEGSSSGHTASSAGGPSSETDSGSQGSGSTSFKTMTLPCIAFPADESRKSVATTQHPNPLYMTITLLPDRDPRKRCFHCMITDCPGTNGAIGFVTPELLSLLFADR